MAIKSLIRKKTDEPTQTIDDRIKEHKTKATANQKAKTKKVKKSPQIRIGNVHNIGARESQQDSFGISDIADERLVSTKGVLAVVADGMGGLSNGAEVSAFVTSYMLKTFSQTAIGQDSSMALLNMAFEVNSEIVRYLSQNGNSQSGSTMVAVVVKDQAMSFVSVGDSRIYLHRGGALFQINREHNYATELDEKAARCEISYEDACSDPQRDALTSYIGMDKLEKIDRNVTPIQLMLGDRIILMTDGVYRTLTEAEIRDTLMQSAEGAALELEDLIISKNKSKQDNFSAVILEFV